MPEDSNITSTQPPLGFAIRLSSSTHDAQYETGSIWTRGYQRHLWVASLLSCRVRCIVVKNL